MASRKAIKYIAFLVFICYNIWMKIPYISNSRLQTFLLCPMQYKFKYDSEIKEPGDKPYYFTFGKDVHKMAQIYCDTKEEIETIAAELNWPDSHIKRLVKIQENIKKIGRKSWKLEWEFNYDLGDGRIVKGFVDRIIKKKNKYIILDLKTTKAGFWRKNTANITQDLQLRIYAMVVSKTFHIPPANISCYLYYLDDGEPVGAKFSIKTLNDTKQYLIDMFKQIENMPVDKVWGNVGDHCGRCSYKNICPTYKIV